jgi:hypothetical protein
MVADYSYRRFEVQRSARLGFLEPQVTPRLRRFEHDFAESGSVQSQANCCIATVIAIHFYPSRRTRLQRLDEGARK